MFFRSNKISCSSRSKQSFHEKIIKRLGHTYSSIKYDIFYDMDEAFEFIDSFDEPVVIKPIGITMEKK